jgi:hypothetical protein
LHRHLPTWTIAPWKGQMILSGGPDELVEADV